MAIGRRNAGRLQRLDGPPRTLLPFSSVRGMCRRGSGVPKDNAQANEWGRKADAQVPTGSPRTTR